MTSELEKMAARHVEDTHDDIVRAIERAAFLAGAKAVLEFARKNQYNAKLDDDGNRYIGVDLEDLEKFVEGELKQDAR